MCMKKEMIGLGAACIYAMSAIYFLYLFYAYNFTDALFLFMYPHWVILLSLVLATIGIFTSLFLYRGKIRMKLFLLITSLIILVWTAILL